MCPFDVDVSGCGVHGRPGVPLRARTAIVCSVGFPLFGSTYCQKIVIGYRVSHLFVLFSSKWRRAGPFETPLGSNIAQRVPSGTPGRRPLPNRQVWAGEKVGAVKAGSASFRWLLFALLALFAVPGTAEFLSYQVTYRGVLSAGTELPIADLSLDERALPGPPALVQTGLSASSAAYPMVERLFPIRYRFRSWRYREGDAPVAFETFQQTSRQRHRLYLQDDSEAGMRRYDLLKGMGEAELRQLETGVSPLESALAVAPLDRLGLLQRVRGLDLHENARYRFEVTDGRDRLVYRVRVEAAQTLNVAGRSVPAWKLRFDGLEMADGGQLQAAHRPVYVWLGRAAGHVPLRVESRHAIGHFRVDLEQVPAAMQLARSAS